MDRTLVVGSSPEIMIQRRIEQECTYSGPDLNQIRPCSEKCGTLAQISDFTIRST